MAILTLGVALPVAAQAPEAEAPRDTIGWHTVREGESLQTITTRYLGTPKLWPENLKLNPELGEGGMLRPGQRIRVILERQVPARSARIESLANDVDKNLQRAGWQDASAGDELKPLDGVRTRELSSANLGFDDGSNLTLSELSQVFLKDVSTSLTGVKRGSIEIVRGQAELELEASRPESVEIEIVLGDAVARPKVGPAGRALTRTRLPQGGGSQLMVYGGSSQLAAGGRQVEVARGMGTSVPEGGVPADPEKLLPAPRTLIPARRSRWDFANPRFTWQPVASAASYTFEVCRDPSCGQLVARRIGLGEPRWQPERLPRGELFWRATAVSASGLDGYPSRAVPFAVLTDAVDLEPPAVVAARIGPGGVSAEGMLILGAGARVRLAARDDASGVAEVRYRWDGGSWQRWRGGDLEPPAGDGEHRLELEADDLLGRTSPVRTVRIERDAQSPEPPAASAPQR